MLSNLPGRIGEQEVEEMIGTVDRNRDGRISYSEFRWDGRIVRIINIVQGLGVGPDSTTERWP